MSHRDADQAANPNSALCTSGMDGAAHSTPGVSTPSSSTRSKLHIPGTGPSGWLGEYQLQKKPPRRRTRVIDEIWRSAKIRFHASCSLLVKLATSYGIKPDHRGIPSDYSPAKAGRPQSELTRVSVSTDHALVMVARLKVSPPGI